MKSIAFIFSIPVSLAVTVLLGMVVGAISVFSLMFIAFVVMLTSMTAMYKVYEYSVLPKWVCRANDVTSTWAFEPGLLSISIGLVIATIGIICGIDLFNEGKKFIGAMLVLIVLSAFVMNVISRLKTSPWYRGPDIVASPDGIKLRKHFVPWKEVQNVTHSQGRAGNWIVIHTLNDISLYSLGKQSSLYYSKTVTVSSVGGLPESIACYLNVRAKAQQAL